MSSTRDGGVLGSVAQLRIAQAAGLVALAVVLNTDTTPAERPSPAPSVAPATATP